MTAREPQVPASALRDALEGLEGARSLATGLLNVKLREYVARAEAALAAAETRGPNEPAGSQVNSGTGWYEVIHPVKVTTHIAYVHEDGSLYLPEGHHLGPDEFSLAAARGDTHRLVRADDLPSSPPAPDVAALLARCEQMDRAERLASAQTGSRVELTLTTRAVRRLLGLDPDSPTHDPADGEESSDGE